MAPRGLASAAFHFFLSPDDYMSPDRFAQRLFLGLKFVKVFFDLTKLELLEDKRFFSYEKMIPVPQFGLGVAVWVGGISGRQRCYAARLKPKRGLVVG